MFLNVHYTKPVEEVINGLGTLLTCLAHKYPLRERDSKGLLSAPVAVTLVTGTTGHNSDLK